MTLKLRHILLFAGIGALLMLAITASAEITKQEEVPIDSIVNYRFFATSTTDVQLATTTSATSTSITPYFDVNGKLDTGMLDMRGAEKVTFYFGRETSGGNAGTSRFEIEVSDDGTNWFNFNKLKGPDISSTATTTYSISASTSTVPISLDLTYDTFNFARCIVVETTDGKHFCRATVEY
jgi:hypothetical protein